jgi:hypothetical protein
MQGPPEDAVRRELAKDNHTVEARRRSRVRDRDVAQLVAAYLRRWVQELISAVPPATATFDSLSRASSGPGVECSERATAGQRQRLLIERPNGKAQKAASAAAVCVSSIPCSISLIVPVHRGLKRGTLPQRRHVQSARQPAQR